MDKPQGQETNPKWDEERRRWEDARYDDLAKRIRKLEQRGRLLDSLNDEKLYMILFGAYIFFGFILPLFVKDEGPKVIEAK